MNPGSTTFGAIVQAEVLLNSKRVAPYVMVALFGANAWLWTVKGASIHNGWATNGDYFIVRNLLGFSFLTLPLFTALIMGDPVSRDFGSGIAPLIFSKPVSRATYLLGKFSGNFFVLVTCQAVFALTMLILQLFPTAQMIVQPVRVFPYLKHFLFFVVISHLFFAAISFTIGTLTRNSKIVYVLAVMFYPLYIAYQVIILKGMPERWRGALDPLLLNWAGAQARAADGGYIRAELINQLSFNYDVVAIANRAVIVLPALVCLTILYLRFSMVERSSSYRPNSLLTTLNLTPAAEWLVPAVESRGVSTLVQAEEITPKKIVEIPKVGVTSAGAGASLKQWFAALLIELRLLFAERGLIVIVPLAVLLCVIGMASNQAIPAGLHTQVYASHAAESLLIFLVAIAIFFTGESMHRDRELRIEPVLWGVPVPNSVLLLSKFGATFLLSISFGLLVGLSAIALQFVRGHTPIEIVVYLRVYLVILIPSMIFMVSAVTMLNVLLRDKYVAYVIGFAISLTLFYLFSQGYNHWLYNPVLQGLWTTQDLVGPNLSRILIHRVYILALAGLCLAVAHLGFTRKTMKSWSTAVGRGHLRWCCSQVS